MVDRHVKQPIYCQSETPSINQQNSDFINSVEKRRPDERWMTMSQAVNNLTARKTASEKISDSFLNLSIAVIAFLAYILRICEDDDPYETQSL